jgi:hypothetical protein
VIAMLAAMNASIVWNGVILASAVGPVLICAARRNDEREALEKQNQQRAV